jgi:hypothetical protein
MNTLTQHSPKRRRDDRRAKRPKGTKLSCFVRSQYKQACQRSVVLRPPDTDNYFVTPEERLRKTLRKFSAKLLEVEGVHSVGIGQDEEGSSRIVVYVNPDHPEAPEQVTAILKDYPVQIRREIPQYTIAIETEHEPAKKGPSRGSG